MKDFAEICVTFAAADNLFLILTYYLAQPPLHHDLIVLTYNKKHLERILDLKIY